MSGRLSPEYSAASSIEALRVRHDIARDVVLTMNDQLLVSTDVQDVEIDKAVALPKKYNRLWSFNLPG